MAACRGRPLPREAGRAADRETPCRRNAAAGARVARRGAGGARGAEGPARRRRRRHGGDRPLRRGRAGRGEERHARRPSEAARALCGGAPGPEGPLAVGRRAAGGGERGAARGLADLLLRLLRAGAGADRPLPRAVAVVRGDLFLSARRGRRRLRVRAGVLRRDRARRGDEADGHRVRPVRRRARRGRDVGIARRSVGVREVGPRAARPGRSVPRDRRRRSDARSVRRAPRVGLRRTRDPVHVERVGAGRARAAARGGEAAAGAGGRGLPA